MERVSAMTEDEIKLEARLFAIEAAVCQLLVALLFQSDDDPLAALEIQRKQWLAGAKQKTFPELGDPALSDLMSAELEAAVDRLAGMEEALLKDMLRRLRNL
jgi:hypothetical protein